MESDDEALAMYLDQDKSSGSDEDPSDQHNPYEETLIKLKDKIGLLKYRCEAGLGFSLTEKAYKLVKNNWDKSITADKTWE